MDSDPLEKRIRPRPGFSIPVNRIFENYADHAGGRKELESTLAWMANENQIVFENNEHGLVIRRKGFTDGNGY